MRDILLVSLGGFLGAMARFGVSQVFQKRFMPTIPWGTLTVNLLGSFLLGFIYGTGPSHYIGLLFGTGFMGAFTTFSTFKLENARMRERGDTLLSQHYMLLSYVFGIILAYLGFLIGGFV